MSLAPHRISLSRGWTTSLGQWKRTFHAPTLPSTTAIVKLVIDPFPPRSRIRLNGLELTWKIDSSRLDFDITGHILSANQLVVEIPDILTEKNYGKLPAQSRNHSPFDIYLEIFEEP